MKKTKSIGVLVAMAFVAGIAAFSTHANGQEQPAKPKAAGPPEWVLEAWETGEAPVVPAIGPPAWVVEAWENGERPQRPTGPPPWIAKRHEMAKELGLPGPPQRSSRHGRMEMDLNFPVLQTLCWTCLDSDR